MYRAGGNMEIPIIFHFVVFLSFVKYCSRKWSFPCLFPQHKPEDKVLEKDLNIQLFILYLCLKFEYIHFFILSNLYDSC